MLDSCGCEIDVREKTPLYRHGDGKEEFTKKNYIDRLTSVNVM